MVIFAKLNIQSDNIFYKLVSYQTVYWQTYILKCFITFICRFEQHLNDVSISCINHWLMIISPKKICAAETHSFKISSLIKRHWIFLKTNQLCKDSSSLCDKEIIAIAFNFLLYFSKHNLSGAGIEILLTPMAAGV